MQRDKEPKKQSRKTERSSINQETKTETNIKARKTFANKKQKRIEKVITIKRQQYSEVAARGGGRDVNMLQN